jgi:hypothetical protein
MPRRRNPWPPIEPPRPGARSFTAKFAEYPFQRLSGKSERALFRGPFSLQNGANEHLLGRFTLPKNAPFDPHSDFPDSLSTHLGE